MKSDRKGQKYQQQQQQQQQEPLPPASSHRHNNSNQQLKCSKCKSVPKRQRQINQVNDKKRVVAKPRQKSEYRQLNSTHSKSMHDTLHDSFENESYRKGVASQGANSRNKPLKRQSNSYCKFLQDKSHIEESTLIDNFFEQKYKESQNELLHTKSKLFENECQFDNLSVELKKLRRENHMLHEKTKSLESDNHQLSKKVDKYRQMARNFKANLTQTASQLDNMKKLSAEEIKTLSHSVSIMEKLVKQRSIQYVTNLKTIQNFLTKIQRMMAPSDQNYSFNVKVLGDLTDLCQQLTKMTIDEEQSLKESLNGSMNGGERDQYRSKDNEEVEFVFSQITTNEYNTGNSQKVLKDDYSTKTKKMLDAYEKMKYESEYLKKENDLLKAKNEEMSFLIEDQQQQSKSNQQYDTKQSDRLRQQNLSVADLIQLDSVCKVNSKLDQKNQYLEEQIIMMKIQMEDLIKQTSELQNIRERQRQDSEEQSVDTEPQPIVSGIREQGKTKKMIPVPQLRQVTDKTQKMYQDHFMMQQSPSEEQSDLCEKESCIPFQRTFDNTTNRYMSNRKFMRPSASTSQIDSSHNRDGFSKLTSAENSRRKNVFKRNCYMDSDKENLTSARDNSTNAYLQNQQQQHQLINVFNYEDTHQHTRPSFANTLSSTSPSIMGGKSFIEKLNLQNTRGRGGVEVSNNNTFRRPAMTSMGSTSTLVINEKAKVLRDEITTLDEEIIQLQNNLKKAIKKKDSKINI